MKVSSLLVMIPGLLLLALPGCSHHEEHVEEAHKITATSPQAKAITLTQEYVCQIHSQRHIKIRALKRGYLEAIKLKEGQTIKQDEPMFSVIPILYKANLEAAKAEANQAELEYKYSKKLFDDNVVSENEVKLKEANMKKLQAMVLLAQAELDFATVKAPFDGIVDRLYHQQGSLVEEGEELSSLSDNSVMWVYFNVPEARYLEYMTKLKDKVKLQIELRLANGNMFDQPGKITAIEADFNNQTGNIPFRADFSNPESLLRHGETGTIVIRRVQEDALVIPQRATFEVLAKRYVYVIDKDNIAHQHEIKYDHELEDLFVVKNGGPDGLNPDDKIVLEGIRQIKDGDKVDYEDRQADQVAKNLKYHAE